VVTAAVLAPVSGPAPAVLSLPPWLEAVLKYTLGQYPTGNETLLRQAGQAMIDQAGVLRAQGVQLRAAATLAAAGMAGTGADQALLQVAVAQADAVAGLGQRLADAGTAVFDYGAKVQETKIVFFVTLAFLAYQVATLVSLAVETGGASLAGIGPLITSAELSLRQVVQDAVLAVLKGAVVGAGVMGGGDALIQALQVATGGRKNFDVNSLKASFTGGAVFGGVFEFLKGVADVLPQVLTKGPVLGRGFTLPAAKVRLDPGGSLLGNAVAGAAAGTAASAAAQKAANPYAPVTDLGPAATGGALLGATLTGLTHPAGRDHASGPATQTRTVGGPDTRDTTPATTPDVATTVERAHDGSLTPPDTGVPISIDTITSTETIRTSTAAEPVDVPRSETGSVLDAATRIVSDSSLPTEIGTPSSGEGGSATSAGTGATATSSQISARSTAAEGASPGVYVDPVDAVSDPASTLHDPAAGPDQPASTAASVHAGDGGTPKLLTRIGDRVARADDPAVVLQQRTEATGARDTNPASQDTRTPSRTDGGDERPTTRRMAGDDTGSGPRRTSSQPIGLAEPGTERAAEQMSELAPSTHEADRDITGPPSTPDQTPGMSPLDVRNQARATLDVPVTDVESLTAEHLDALHQLYPGLTPEAARGYYRENQQGWRETTLDHMFADPANSRPSWRTPKGRLLGGSSSGGMYGESNPSARLTWRQVHQIRLRLAAGESSLRIAADPRVPVSDAAIRAIRSNDSWWDENWSWDEESRRGEYVGPPRLEQDEQQLPDGSEYREGLDGRPWFRLSGSNRWSSNIVEYIRQAQQTQPGPTHDEAPDTTDDTTDWEVHYHEGRPYEWNRRTNESRWL
jgi:hypothetical protein